MSARLSKCSRKGRPLYFSLIASSSSIGRSVRPDFYSTTGCARPRARVFAANPSSTHTLTKADLRIPFKEDRHWRSDCRQAGCQPGADFAKCRYDRRARYFEPARSALMASTRMLCQKEPTLLSSSSIRTLRRHAAGWGLKPSLRKNARALYCDEGKVRGILHRWVRLRAEA
jgi:hypothetical protein